MPFLAALKDMQDRFGELNDIIVHEKLATGIAATLADRPAGPVRRAFAAGLLTGHEEARFKPVLIAAERAFRAFEKLKPYWR
jgi:triphosphatase